MAAPEVIDVYVDVISPYAYLGWVGIQQLAERRGLGLRVHPILFAALLDAHGQLGPAEVVPKRSYIFKHVVRLAHEQGVPLAPPFGHPFNPILPLRVAVASEGAAMDALFAGLWQHGEDLTRADIMRRVLDRAGLDGEALVAAAGEPSVKLALREGTQRAIDRGVFGVPTYGVGDELFWGQDSLPHLDAYLDGEDPVAPVRDAWAALPVATHRASVASR